MPSQTKPPILIVDDEPDVLFSIKGLLRHDFQLHVAESGEEALRVLREHDIHVVMTDQRMPGMSGVALMQQVRSQFPDAIRIVFTGFADIKAVVNAINTGGLYRYITKPWDPDELIETLHEAARRYAQLKSQKRFAAEVKSLADDLKAAVDASDPEESKQLVADLVPRAADLAVTVDQLF